MVRPLPPPPLRGRTTIVEELFCGFPELWYSYTPLEVLMTSSTVFLFNYLFPMDSLLLLLDKIARYFNYLLYIYYVMFYVQLCLTVRSTDLSILSYIYTSWNYLYRDTYIRWQLRICCARMKENRCFREGRNIRFARDLIKCHKQIK